MNVLDAAHAHYRCTHLPKGESLVPKSTPKGPKLARIAWATTLHQHIRVWEDRGDYVLVVGLLFDANGGCISQHRREEILDNWEVA